MALCIFLSRGALCLFESPEMWPVLIVLELVSIVAANDFAFVAPSWQNLELSAGQTRITPVVPEVNNGFPKQAKSGTASSAAFLLGVSALLIALNRRQTRNVSRNVWIFFPMNKEKQWPGLGEDATGSSWRSHMNLRRHAKLMMDRKIRYMKQQKVLRDHDVWWATYDKFKVWNPNPKARQMYMGPESHPDNPDFPRPNSGLPALGGWSPAPMAASTGRLGGSRLAGAFSSAKRAVFSSPRVRSALVRHAHKKAAASTKNQGYSSRPKWWGVKALNGKAVKTRQLLVKQKGMNWYPGNNVTVTKSGALMSLKDGIVQWRGTYRHKEVSVVPWEYVRAKCRWHNDGNLAPQEYLPWMGRRNEVLSGMYDEWAETTEGKAWLEKKAEKKAKQKEIQAKIRAKKQWRFKEQKTKDKVTAGDSDSETEK